MLLFRVTCLKHVPHNFGTQSGMYCFSSPIEQVLWIGKLNLSLWVHSNLAQVTSKGIISCFSFSSLMDEHTWLWQKKNGQTLSTGTVLATSIPPDHSLSSDYKRACTSCNSILSHYHSMPDLEALTHQLKIKNLFLHEMSLGKLWTCSLFLLQWTVGRVIPNPSPLRQGEGLGPLCLL